MPTIFSYAPIDFRTRKSTNNTIPVEPGHAPVMAEAEPIQDIAPLPPLPPIPAFVLPMAALPLPPLPPVQPLPTTNPLCNDPQYSHLFDHVHPIEPMPIYPKPKMQRFRSGK